MENKIVTVVLILVVAGFIGAWYSYSANQEPLNQNQTNQSIWHYVTNFSETNTQLSADFQNSDFVGNTSIFHIQGTQWRYKLFCIQIGQYGNAIQVSVYQNQSTQNKLIGTPLAQNCEVSTTTNYVYSNGDFYFLIKTPSSYEGWFIQIEDYY